MGDITIIVLKDSALSDVAGDGEFGARLRAAIMSFDSGLRGSVPIMVDTQALPIAFVVAHHVQNGRSQLDLSVVREMCADEPFTVIAVYSQHLEVIGGDTVFGTVIKVTAQEVRDNPTGLTKMYVSVPPKEFQYVADIIGFSDDLDGTTLTIAGNQISTSAAA